MSVSASDPQTRHGQAPQVRTAVVFDVDGTLLAAEVAPDRAVMVVDTVYDVRAAAAAGVPCVGLVAGGISDQELREAGAAAVHGNCADLLDGLDASPLGRLLA